MTIDNNDNRPRYACSICGSDEVRGNFDTYPVFLAEGDRLVYRRLESTDAGIEALYCNECHEQIEIDDNELGNLDIV